MGQDTAWRKHVKKIFDEALEKAPAERAAFLDSVCDGEPEVRARVERLLSMIDDDPAFLEEPPRTTDFGAGDLTDLDGDGDLSGQHISHYHLGRAIAAGGMGTVYEAVQENPHRTVAVKVMKQGIASRSAMRRFEYEAQILARLRHPGIAQVYEAGTYDEAGGVPYFVMEYVPSALHITKYAREKKLTTRRRLELFSQVCEAVHHGHQRGIIHRDLKPANILIDSSGQPKIIDFGVARATDSDVALTTLHTHLGELVGTLQYMSPEQCRAEPDDLDTRSDVYSLGVVLYELLCDRLPYDVTHAPVPEAVRVIRDETPVRPSTVNRTLRGDLETVVLKALEKDRERRYQSAADLSADITRYLSHEPIDARPPSAIYQLRKFARRNRALVTGAVAVVLVLVAGVAVSTSLYLKSESAARESARQARIAREVSRFLNRDLLAAVAPDALGPDVTMLKVLNAASERLEGRFPDEQLVEASIRETLGDTYRQLAEYDLSGKHLTQALEVRTQVQGLDHPDTLQATYLLARLRFDEGEFDESETLVLGVLDRAGRVFGPDQFEPLQYTAFLGELYRSIGRYDDALRMLKPAWETAKRLGIHNQTTIDVMINLGLAMRFQGALDEAEVILRDGLTIAREFYGDEHPVTIMALNNLADLRSAMGDYDEAETLWRQSLELRRRVFGEEHPRTLTGMNNLAASLSNRGRYAEAELLSRETLTIRRRVLPEDHPKTLVSLSNLAYAIWRQDRLEEAALLYTQLVELRRKVFGPESTRVAFSLNTLGLVRRDQGRLVEAASVLTESLEIARVTYGEQHRQTIVVRHSLAMVYQDLGQMDEAERLFATAVEMLHNAWPEGHWRIAYLHYSYGTLLLQRERYSDAESALLTGYAGYRAAAGPQYWRKLGVVESLVTLYDAWGKPELAAEYRHMLPVEQETVTTD